jgi:phosphatidylserine/phosphatidylglycerophosphate/cardiolipin synthase-like enzyme
MMSTLPDVVIHLVDDLPEDHVSHLASLLQNESHHDWNRLYQLLRTAVPQLDTQERIRVFIDEWQSLPQPPSPSEMALLLESVSAALDHERLKQKIELTWTGPRNSRISFRRTDQALLELINTAQERILIVSFAVYKARTILSAMENAALRGVEITIILESPEVSEGQIAYNTVLALGASLREKSKVFIWPIAKRAITPDGKTGSLHAKVGVADGNYFYLSSANLTDYAMSINMEMGVLISGGDLPVLVENHFNEMIAAGILVEIEGER